MGIICRRRGAAKGGRQHIEFFFQNRFQWRHCDVTKSGAEFFWRRFYFELGCLYRTGGVCWGKGLDGIYGMVWHKDVQGDKIHQQEGT